MNKYKSKKEVVYKAYVRDNICKKSTTM